MLTRPDPPTTASRPLAFHPEQLEGASRAARRPAASPAEVAHAPPAQGATAPAAFAPTGAPAPARGSPLRTPRAVALEQGHRAAHGRRDVQMTGVGHGHPRARRASSASGRTRASVSVNVSVSVGLWGRAWSRVLVLVLGPWSLSWPWSWSRPRCDRWRDAADVRWGCVVEPTCCDVGRPRHLYIIARRREGHARRRG